MNPLKEAWRAGQPTLGGWATLASPLAAEMLSRAGFAYVCIDNQHGINDYAGTVGLLQAIDCGDATPIVRVPWNEPGIIGKMLDAGADGIIIPMVNSVAEAEAAVRACRYAPDGTRSYGPTRASLRSPDYFVTANDHVACIPMIETVAALESLDDILAVPGIDAIYVGPADLSVSLGLAPGNNDDESVFVQALESIVAACNHHGVVPGIHATPSLTPRRLEMGFRMVTVTADNVAMRDGLGLALAPMTTASDTGAPDALY